MKQKIFDTERTEFYKKTREQSPDVLILSFLISEFNGLKNTYSAKTETEKL